MKLENANAHLLKINLTKSYPVGTYRRSQLLGACYTLTLKVDDIKIQDVFEKCNELYLNDVKVNFVNLFLDKNKFSVAVSKNLFKKKIGMGRDFEIRFRDDNKKNLEYLGGNSIKSKSRQANGFLASSQIVSPLKTFKLENKFTSGHTLRFEATAEKINEVYENHLNYDQLFVNGLRGSVAKINFTNNTFDVNFKPKEFPDLGEYVISLSTSFKDSESLFLEAEYEGKISQIDKNELEFIIENNSQKKFFEKKLKDEKTQIALNGLPIEIEKISSGRFKGELSDEDLLNSVFKINRIVHISLLDS